MSHLMTCVDAPNCTWTDLAVMFRLLIVRMRPESGNSTYMTGRRPTRALEVQ